MKVKEAKELLNMFDDEQEIVVLNEDRLHHDDAVYGFSIVAGFSNRTQNIADVRLEEITEPEHHEFCDTGDDCKGCKVCDGLRYIYPCCAILF